MSMEFEKLGAFYLGKEYDVAGKKLLDRLLMYDARDLTTHAVCVGMTGSGKTGLCLILLEEAAIDHVPAIIIDPKGDITNLLLTFPDLKPEDFRPWVNVDDARRKGMSEDDFAAQQAESWRSGLSDWGQDGERIRLLRESADFAIYTPGSDAGIPVSILQSFAAPPLSWESEAEMLRERVQGTVSALLGLVGIDADPVRSREHILLSNLFEHFWRQGEGLDLPKLILSIQSPPIRQLGVFDVDTFFPEKERFELAMTLNNIIAAPAFQSWLEGQPLDVAGFLATPEGKPRHSIFYIAHLSDAERMFFVTMLLNQVITWMRAQPGTTSLRALLYMDEIFGFFPPVANPPSKQPMLTLLKQARAFGVGTVLTTQNPVDLDYKGLTNAGTWFIGRLQAERDKGRLLEGLESASSQAGRALNKDELGRVISGLGKRVFLLHNVHEDAPVTFHTRWAMSYLRGPLTRTQVRELAGGRAGDQPVPAPQAGVGAAAPPAAPETPSAEAPAPGAQLPSAPPPLPSSIQQVYLPVRRGVSTVIASLEEQQGGALEVQARSLLYMPAALGLGTVYFRDQKRGVNEEDGFALCARPAGGVAVSWDGAQRIDLAFDDLLDRSEPEALFDELPELFSTAQKFTALKKDLGDYLYYNSSVTLLHSPALKLYSEPGENERDFSLRLQQAAREERDAEVDKISDRHKDRLDRLQDQLRRAEAALARKEADAEARKREVLVSVGESVVGMFLGRRSTRAASTALSKHRQTTMKKLEVEEAEASVAAIKEDIKELEEELRQEVEAVQKRWDESLEQLEQVEVKPRRADVRIDLLALAWTPHWRIVCQKAGGVPRTELVAAY
ncbi:MAG: hypothetical protein JW900_15765 [Anaerolineae bacterium]|nr:hypothetical protein [Anaerolineae bacterium]